MYAGCGFEIKAPALFVKLRGITNASVTSKKKKKKSPADAKGEPEIKV